MSDVAVAVVGGGISGLAAAYELHARQVPFILYEKSERLGGMIHTESVGPFTIDAGPDSLVVQKPAAIALCREIGLADRLIPTQTPRIAYVVRNDVLHPLPPGSVFGIPTTIGSLSSQRLLSRRGRLRLGMELLVPRGRDNPTGQNPEENARDESIAAFFRRRFGAEATDYLAEPLLAGIHSGDVERLSMHALFPQFVEAERVHGSVIRAFRRKAAERASTTQEQGPFRSFPEGLEELPRALAARLPAHCLRRGVRVTGIVGGPPYALHAGDGTRMTADQVILALPASITAPLAAGIDPAVGRLCDSFTDTSIAIVVLAFPRAAVAHPLDGSGFVVPRVAPGLSITAATWISSKWPGRAPHDHVLLRGFVGGARRPEALALSDEVLVDTVRDDLTQLLGIRGEPVLARVFRWPRANPQYHVGHRARVAEIDQRLEQTPGLQIIGAAFHGVGIGDCVAAGRTAGAAAASALGSRS